MAKAWKDVIASPEYQALAPAQKAQAQEQYFTEVVAPQAGEQAEQARRAFYSAYPLPMTQNQSQPAPQQPANAINDPSMAIPGNPPQEQPARQAEPSLLQNAGQVVEQAARGLVNIPFDVMQGGASLINSASQAIGGPKVLDDVYRPIDRPTDPYAQAGEAIGGYMIPGLGVAGNIAVGSLAEASNQKGDFTENALKNTALNLGAQGALSAVAKGIGRGVTAVRGDIAPEVKQAIDTAEGMGVTPMTSDALPPSNAFTRGLMQGGEGALMGTGSQRAEQYATRSSLVKNYFDRVGEYNPDDVVKSLTTTLRGRKDSAGAVINDVTNKMGNAVVDTTNTMSALNTAISRQERLGSSANKSLLSSLRNLREELSNPATDLDVTFDLLRQHRTAFRSNVQGDAMVFPDQAKATTNMIENAMTRDLRNSVGKTLGPSEAANYIKANSDYANVYNKVLNKRISSVLNNATHQATPELINTVVYSRKPSDIKRIWSALDDKGKDAMRAAYVSRIAESSGGSPARFLTQVNKLKRQADGDVYGTIFSGKHMKELDALHDVLQLTSRADSANVVTQTGQALANPLRIGAAIPTLGQSLAGEAGFGLVMRAYESRPVRNALLRLANTKAGTPAYEKALNEAALAIRPLVSQQAND